MKTNKYKYIAGLPGVVLLFIAMVFTTAGCKKNSSSPMTGYGPNYTVTNLVADNANYGAAHIDPNLVNAWGIAISPTGRLWVASTGKGVTTIYDGSGATLIQPIMTGSMMRGGLGQPTGAVYNSTADFVIPRTGAVSKFIYVSLDGLVTAWSSGDSCNVVANDQAQYTGAAIANDGTGNCLFATDYAGASIDAYDKDFKYIESRTFTDPNMTTSYSPYNVHNIGGMLYVTYAPKNNTFLNGAPNGFVDIFNPNGTFVKRFASGGPLSFPWGIAQAPSGFGLGANMILIGNFGDGRINIYDMNGVYKGQLQSNGRSLSIDGLWAIVPAPSSASSLDQNAIYFAAGPGGQAHGLVGYIKQQ
jgi:uncharacterized protein (TIGR03118 family)